MNDQELLELAAKAAGINGKYNDFYTGDYYYQGETEGIEIDGGVWNPLTDEGDALRLAIELDMMISINRLDAYTEASCGYSNENLVTIRESHGDIFYATRRAIVRAAAEIGKSL